MQTNIILPLILFVVFFVSLIAFVPGAWELLKPVVAIFLFVGFIAAALIRQ